MIASTARLSALLLPLRAGILVSKFALVILITRLIGLEAMGQYALAVSVTLIVPAIAGGGLMSTLAREIVDTPASHVAAEVGRYWLLTTAAYLVLTVPFVLIAQIWTTPAFAVLLLLLARLEQFNLDAYVILTNQRRSLAANILLFVQSASWIMAYCAAALAIPDLRHFEGVLSFWFLGQAGGLLVFAALTRDWPWREALRLPSVAWVRHLVRTGRLIWLHGVADRLMTSADRLVIGALLGLELTGIYAFYWHMANAVRTLVDSTIYQPRRADLIAAFSGRDFARHKRLTHDIWRHAAVLASLAMVGLWVLLHVGGPYLAVPQLADHGAIAPMMFAAMWVRILSDVGAYALFTAKQDKVFLGSTLIGAALTWSANAILIPVLSISGAVLAFLVAGAAMGIWRVVHLLRLWRAAIPTDTSGTGRQP